MEGAHQINAKIRPAKSEDMIQVYQLIKELAVSEKLQDQVRIDASTLIKDGFSTDQLLPAFTCLVAELPNNNEIIGYALYYQSYSTWLGRSIFLEDLYVQNNYRRHGIGKELFLAVAKIAHNQPSKRLDFHVLSWNPAGEFYKRIGAVNLTEIEKWQLFRLNEDALNQLFPN